MNFDDDEHTVEKELYCKSTLETRFALNSKYRNDIVCFILNFCYNCGLKKLTHFLRKTFFLDFQIHEIK